MTLRLALSLARIEWLDSIASSSSKEEKHLSKRVSKWREEVKRQQTVSTSQKSVAGQCMKRSEIGLPLWESSLFYWLFTQATGGWLEANSFCCTLFVALERQPFKPLIWIWIWIWTLPLQSLVCGQIWMQHDWNRERESCLIPALSRSCFRRRWTS